MRFQDKVVIVTGSGKGIGKAIAIDFAKEGARVVLVSRTIRDLIEVADDIKKLGSQSLIVQADVSKEDDVKEIFKKTLEEYQTVDILVNNAAIQIRNHILDVSIEEWKTHLDINLTGAFLCTREALNIMLNKNYGKIINIASEAGLKAWATGSAYCASKFGMIGLTEASAADVKDKEININAICPAGVDTPLTRKSYPKLDFSRIRLMKSDDVSKVVLFIASEDARAIKGSFINVSDGQNLLDGNE